MMQKVNKKQTLNIILDDSKRGRAHQLRYIRMVQKYDMYLHKLSSAMKCFVLCPGLAQYHAA